MSCMRHMTLNQSGAPSHVIDWTNFSQWHSEHRFRRNFQCFTRFLYYSKNPHKRTKILRPPQHEISQPILSKNGFVKQIWPLTDCTATRSDF